MVSGEAAARRKPGEVLREQGLEAPTRRHGVVKHHTDTERLCRSVEGVEVYRTKAGKLWVSLWAVAALSGLRGKPQAMVLRALRHYAAAPPEERAALCTAWRLHRGQRGFMQALVNPARFSRPVARSPRPRPVAGAGKTSHQQPVVRELPIGKTSAQG